MSSRASRPRDTAFEYAGKAERHNERTRTEKCIKRREAALGLLRDICERWVLGEFNGHVRNEVVSELESILTTLRLATRDTLHAIHAWEGKGTEDNSMYIWHGECYIGKMLTDTLFLDDKGLGDLRSLLPGALSGLPSPEAPRRLATEELVLHTISPESVPDTTPPCQPVITAWGGPSPVLHPKDVPQPVEKEVASGGGTGDPPGVHAPSAKFGAVAPADNAVGDADPVAEAVAGLDAELFNKDAMLSAAQARGQLEKLLNEGPTVRRTEISHNDSYMYSSLDPPAEDNPGSFLSSASCPLEESVAMWKLCHEVSPPSRLMEGRGSGAFDPVGMAENATAFHTSKKPAAVLLHLLNRLVVRDDSLPGVPSPKLVLPLAAANSTTSLCLSCSTIEMCAERRLPTAKEIYGAGEFRITVGELQKFEASTRIHIASSVPALFYSHLTALAAEEGNVLFFSTLMDVPLCRLTNPAEWDAALSHLVHSISEGKDALTKLRLRRESGAHRENDVEEGIAQKKSAIRSEQTQVDFLRNRAFDGRLQSVASNVGKLTSAVRSAPEEFGFESIDHATRTLRLTATDLSAKAAVSQLGLHLTNGLKGCTNQLVAASTEPTLLVHAHYEKESHDETHTSVLCACVENGVKHLSVTSPNVSWLRSLVNVASQPQFSRLTLWVNPGKAHLDASVRLVSGLSASAPRVVVHLKSPKFLADQLGREGYQPGLLVHAAATSVMLGCVGGSWEAGTTQSYGDEEDIAATSTALIAHSAISHVYSDTFRCVTAQLAGTGAAEVSDADTSLGHASGSPAQGHAHDMRSEYNTSGATGISMEAVDAPSDVESASASRPASRQSGRGARGSSAASQAAARARETLQQLLEEELWHAQQQVALCEVDEGKQRQSLARQEENKFRPLVVKKERLLDSLTHEARQLAERQAANQRLLTDRENHERTCIEDKERSEQSKIFKRRTSLRKLQGASVAVQETPLPAEVSPIAQGPHEADADRPVSRRSSRASLHMAQIERMKANNKAIMDFIELEERKRMLQICTEQEQRYIIVMAQVKEIEHRRTQADSMRLAREELHLHQEEHEGRAAVERDEMQSRRVEEAKTDDMTSHSRATASLKEALEKVQSLCDEEAHCRESLARPQSRDWEAIMTKMSSELGLLRFLEASRACEALKVKEQEARDGIAAEHDTQADTLYCEAGEAVAALSSKLYDAARQALWHAEAGARRAIVTESQDTAGMERIASALQALIREQRCLQEEEQSKRLAEGEGEHAAWLGIEAFELSDMRSSELEEAAAKERARISGEETNEKGILDDEWATLRARRAAAPAEDIAPPPPVGSSAKEAPAARMKEEITTEASSDDGLAELEMMKHVATVCAEETLERTVVEDSEEADKRVIQSSLEAYKNPVGLRQAEGEAAADAVEAPPAPAEAKKAPAASQPTDVLSVEVPRKADPEVALQAQQQEAAQEAVEGDSGTAEDDRQGDTKTEPQAEVSSEATEPQESEAPPSEAEETPRTVEAGTTSPDEGEAEEIPRTVEAGTTSPDEGEAEETPHTVEAGTTSPDEGEAEEIPRTVEAGTTSPDEGEAEETPRTVEAGTTSPDEGEAEEIPHTVEAGTTSPDEGEAEEIPRTVEAGTTSPDEGEAEETPHTVEAGTTSPDEGEAEETPRTVEAGTMSPDEGEAEEQTPAEQAEGGGSPPQLEEAAGAVEVPPTPAEEAPETPGTPEAACGVVEIPAAAGSPDAQDDVNPDMPTVVLLRNILGKEDGGVDDAPWLTALIVASSSPISPQHSEGSAESDKGTLPQGAPALEPARHSAAGLSSTASAAVMDCGVESEIAQPPPVSTVDEESKARWSVQNDEAAGWRAIDESASASASASAGGCLLRTQRLSWEASEEARRADAMKEEADGRFTAKLSEMRDRKVIREKEKVAAEEEDEVGEKSAEEEEKMEEKLEEEEVAAAEEVEGKSSDEHDDENMFEDTAAPEEEVEVREQERDEPTPEPVNLENVTDIKEVVHQNIQNALVSNHAVVNSPVDSIRQRRQSEALAEAAVTVVQRAWRRHSSNEIRKQKKAEHDVAETQVDKDEIRMHEFYEEAMQKISRLILGIVSRKRAEALRNQKDFYEEVADIIEKQLFAEAGEFDEDQGDSGKDPDVTGTEADAKAT